MSSSSFKRNLRNSTFQGTLVFDGAHKRGEESGLSYPSPLIVAYTPKGESADEYIIEQFKLPLSPVRSL